MQKGPSIEELVAEEVVDKLLYVGWMVDQGKDPKQVRSEGSGHAGDQSECPEASFQVPEFYLGPTYSGVQIRGVAAYLLSTFPGCSGPIGSCSEARVQLF